MKNEQARELEVVVQVKRQGTLLEGIDIKVNDLITRLSDVLSQSRPQATSNEETKSSELCPLANEIRSHNEHLEKIEMLIDEVVDRIEI